MAGQSPRTLQRPIAPAIPGFLIDKDGCRTKIRCQRTIAWGLHRLSPLVPGLPKKNPNGKLLLAPRTEYKPLDDGTAPKP
jgi:hypothetical protein